MEGMTDFQFKAVIRMVMTIIKDSESKEEIPVSYTHLTLPTT